MDEEQLRRVFQDEKPNRRGWRCPSDELLAGYADGGLADKERARMERHLAGCMFCREQAASLMKLSEQPLPEMPPALLERAVRLSEGTAQVRTGRPWRWAMVTAIACVALAASLLVRQANTPSASEPAAENGPRASVPHATDSVRKSPVPVVPLALEFPHEGATLSPQNIELTWNAMPGSLSYDVLVVDVAGDVKWQKSSETTHLRLPLNALPRGKYYVSISARLADGKTTRSPAVGFQVASED